MKKRLIKQRKQFSELKKEVDTLSKPSECLLCHQKKILCDSHVVPRFVLEGISDSDNKISHGQSLLAKEEDIIDTTKGVKNAFLFKLICRDCDQKVFKDYENAEALLNFDTLNYEKKKKILCEMAIKSHLSHINIKTRSQKLMDITYPEVAFLMDNSNMKTARELDIEEHLRYIKRLKNYSKSSNFPFEVLYNQLLDYTIPIATQTIIAYVYDLKGNQMFDPYNMDYADQMMYFNLVVLPVKGKTRVLFYVDKSRAKASADFINQFNELSGEDKLHFLFISLILHDEDFFMNPDFNKNILLKDKFLIKLYRSTDFVEYNHLLFREIANFKNYKNYFLPKYALEQYEASLKHS